MFNIRAWGPALLLLALFIAVLLMPAKANTPIGRASCRERVSFLV